MKRGYFLLILALSIIGCNISTNTAVDGKGEIDIVSYFPKESNIKKYTGGSSKSSNIIKSATSRVDVIDSTILEHIDYSTTLNGNSYDTVYDINTTYNDINITKIFKVDNQINSFTFYRYVNQGEEHSNSKKEYFKDYIEDSIKIGKIYIKEQNICKYYVVEQILLLDKIVKKGNFLEIECIKKLNKRYYIDNEYILDNRYKNKNGKEFYEESISKRFYKKTIGYYGYIIENEKSTEWLLADN